MSALHMIQDVHTAHQLSDGHLGEVTQAQVHLIPADFILQVQHFAVFTHSGVSERNTP